MKTLLLTSAEAEKAARGEGFAPFERAVRACLDGYMEAASMTPFGLPVVPDVKRISAMPSGSGSSYSAAGRASPWSTSL